MKKLVLDTSVLLRWWNRCRSRHRGEVTPAHAEQWGRQLSELHDTRCVLRPIVLEVFGGTTSKRDLELMRSFLRPFQAIDEQRIPPRDWTEAERMAQRVPRNRRHRDLADCLIRAIADRLAHDVLTYDEGFPG